MEETKLMLVTYDLREPVQDYSRLYEILKTSFLDWQHPMESVWVVKVGHDVMANDVFNKIADALSPKDLVFIVEITGQDRQGWLGKNFWDWMKNNA